MNWIRSNIKDIVIALLSFLLLGLFWYWFGNGLGIALAPGLKHAESMSEWGDMYGALNAFFSILAFVVIAMTLILQRADLNLQRKELQLTRLEFLISRLGQQMIEDFKESLSPEFELVRRQIRRTIEAFQSFDETYDIDSLLNVEDIIDEGFIAFNDLYNGYNETLRHLHHTFNQILKDQDNQFRNLHFEIRGLVMRAKRLIPADVFRFASEIVAHKDEIEGLLDYEEELEKHNNLSTLVSSCQKFISNHGELMKVAINISSDPVKVKVNL